MKHLIWNVYSNHRRSTAIFIGALGSCILALALFWGVSGLLLIPRTASVNAKANSETAALAVQGPNGRTPASLNKDVIASGPAAVEQLQESLVAEAQETGCSVTQFTPDATPAAYVSVYGVQDSDFGSYHVHTSVKGNLGNVLLCLQKLADGPAPFEVVSMSIDGSSGGQNASIVTVSLVLQVVSKAPAPPPAGGS